MVVSKITNKSLIEAVFNTTINIIIIVVPRLQFKNHL